MNGLELKQVMMKRRAEAFWGNRYWYNTPNDGRVQIGVLAGLGGDVFIVAYFRGSGSRRAIKTKRLPAGDNPAVLQGLLDVWAQERGLELVDTKFSDSESPTHISTP
jgi:hypothetical protein